MGREESFCCLHGMWGCSQFLPSTWEGDPDGLRWASQGYCEAGSGRRKIRMWTSHKTSQWIILKKEFPLRCCYTVDRDNNTKRVRKGDLTLLQSSRKLGISLSVGWKLMRSECPSSSISRSPSTSSRETGAQRNIINNKHKLASATPVPPTWYIHVALQKPGSMKPDFSRLAKLRSPSVI